MNDVGCTVSPIVSMAPQLFAENLELKSLLLVMNRKKDVDDLRTFEKAL